MPATSIAFWPSRNPSTVLSQMLGTTLTKVIGATPAPNSVYRVSTRVVKTHPSSTDPASRTVYFFRTSAQPEWVVTVVETSTLIPNPDVPQATPPSNSTIPRNSNNKDSSDAPTTLTLAGQGSGSATAPTAITNCTENLQDNPTVSNSDNTKTNQPEEPPQPIQPPKGSDLNSSPPSAAAAATETTAPLTTATATNLKLTTSIETVSVTQQNFESYVHNKVLPLISASSYNNKQSVPPGGVRIPIPIQSQVLAEGVTFETGGGDWIVRVAKIAKSISSGGGSTNTAAGGGSGSGVGNASPSNTGGSGTAAAPAGGITGNQDGGGGGGGVLGTTMEEQGVVVELEYLPIPYLAPNSPIFIEFFQSLFPPTCDWHQVDLLPVQSEIELNGKEVEVDNKEDLDKDMDVDVDDDEGEEEDREWTYADTARCWIQFQKQHNIL